MFIRNTFGPNLLKSIKFPVNSLSTMSINKKLLEQSRNELKSMFYAGIKAVAPKLLIENNIKIQDNQLHFKDNTIPLGENVYLIGFGKAVMTMAMTLEPMLGDRLKKGIINCPKVSRDILWETEDKSNFPMLRSTKIIYNEVGKNNLPDQRSWRASHDIIDLVESITTNDTLIVLISGGGSACLYMPRPRIDTDDKLHIIKILQKAGADITELNTVRQKLSLVKGGGLARMAYPATVITFILSDIVGDPLNLIASGPTVYSPKDPKSVIEIITKYGLNLEGDLKAVLYSKETFNDKKLINKKTKQFKHVTNYLLGNNLIAIEAAASEAKHLKLTSIILGNDILGNVHEVSLAYVFITSLICQAMAQKIEKVEFYNKVKDLPILKLSPEKVDHIFSTIDKMQGDTLVLIGGGEPTVKVTGKGKGGRNLELALHFSLDWLAKIKGNPWYAEYDVLMLSAGTDGQDGPTDAAGAFGYPAVGPIIHNSYKQLESLSKKQIGDMEAKEYADRKLVEDAIASKLKVVCKRRDLSLFKEPQTPKPEDLDYEFDETSVTGDTDDLSDNIKWMLLKVMEAENLLPENALQNNNTYNFYSRFKKGEDLFKTGYTDTNVMDLHFISIKKRNCPCSFDMNIEAPMMDEHDLSISNDTINRYEGQEIHVKLERGREERRTTMMKKDKPDDRLNITIIDDNFAEPCCSKKRKFPDHYKK
ncbi:glycerate kinase [Prorops nasuta]|uniref:glycerate kinase n=1 Tax=Prorops nasuta TaxID=863751 RepID=UPI0034CEE793